MLALASAAPRPQTARDATLRVERRRSEGAVIVNAKVTLQPIDPAGAPIEAVTNDRGEAAFTALTPGRYAVRAEFPGFDAKQMDDVRLRAGDNTRREMKLNLAKIAARRRRSARIRAIARSIRAATRSATC